MGDLLLRLKTAWLVSLAAPLVMAVAQPPTATDPVRGGHKVTQLADGTVLVTGGHNSQAYLTSVEIYDPVTGTLSPTGSLRTARALHSATLLANGTVLVVGGSNGTGYLASAEIYDPATGTFSPTGSLATARQHQTATLLANGTVLVVGGFGLACRPCNRFGAGPLASAEIYDTASGTFFPTGSLATARGGHTATRLADGTVLVVGGLTMAPGPASDEIYDPATGAWAMAPSTANAHCTPRDTKAEAAEGSTKLRATAGGEPAHSLERPGLFRVEMLTALPTLVRRRHYSYHSHIQLSLVLNT